MKVTKATKTSNVDPKKVNKVYKQIVEAFRETKLTAAEIILVYSNLGYTLGASIGGYKTGEGPSLDDLQKAYAIEPKIDVALMLQALLTSTWVDDLDKKIEDIKEEAKKKKNVKR